MKRLLGNSEMSKFGCTCGNVISDVVCPNEVTGSILSDKSNEKFFDGLQSILDDCFEHQTKGKTNEWMMKHFNDQYPSGLSLGSMLHDVLHSSYLDLTLSVMECESCGRLWVQRSVGENYYREYTSTLQTVTHKA